VPPSDVVCFSHLAWNHVFQRPNHLMTRAAASRRVFFVEEPFDAPAPCTRIETVAANISTVRFGLSFDLPRAERFATLARLLDELAASEGIVRPWRWYLTPMALPWSDALEASAVVYDCMDELSAFRGAPVDRLVELEAALFERADVVFAGGPRLWQAKRDRHPNVHLFASAVDVEHFGRARRPGVEPDDQATIARPRIGFFGVIDERLDLDLLRDVFASRPDWQLVLVGPLAKIAPDDLPNLPNVHLLGRKPYESLPDYLRGWDVAILPFAHGPATQFISPTKTPEYLAGGRPVVSTSIHDVVETWGGPGLVQIADGAGAFAAAIGDCLAQPDAARAERQVRADLALSGLSWDATWSSMESIVEATIEPRGVAA
jgi:glycosyltransferase involved in cell wall biosynthesis